MRNVKLNNGVNMPILGFGVYQIKDPKLCEKSVKTAIDVGYRLIDTAFAYGNENAVGKAVQTSSIPRDELFITTKLWSPYANYENAKQQFEKSLNRLEMDYVDLYLIHQPFGDVYGSWRAMEELYKEGKIRAIGVSNFYPDRLIDFILHNNITPAVNQVETHPFNQQIENKKIMKEYNVQIESWGPFAEGRNNLFQNEVLASIGEKYNKSNAQVTLRWLIQSEVIVIPKSVHEERIVENFDVFNFELNKEEMSKITSLDQKKSAFFDHHDPEWVKRLSSARRD